MKLIILMGIFPDNQYDTIISNSKGVIQYAADALQKSFLEGLISTSNNLDLEIINLPYIGSFPRRYTKLFSKDYKFQFESKNGHIVQGENIKFCNLAGYKHISRYIHTKKKLNSICSSTEDNVVCIIYAIHSPFLLAALDVKKKYPSKLKILQIVPDLPEYMDVSSDNTNSFKKLLRNWNLNNLKKSYHKIDAFVLLSKYMKNPLGIHNQPWIVIEGIYNSSVDELYLQKIKKDTTLKTILYSGTLASRYGIENLVKAFRLIPNKNYRLLICGDGDFKNELKEHIKQDSRIVYKGQLPRKDILQLQRYADLLVNPRTPDGEFTKYSFPSKTMEYLASGTPTLLYKLPGIPDEYYKYCFTLDANNNIDDLSKEMTNILNLPEDILKQKGIEARNYIFNNKNPYVQCQKIFKLIEKLF